MKFKKHFTFYHTWLDFFGMFSLWILLWAIGPFDIPIFVITIIKVFAIVATLEFLSFTFFHFFSSRKNLLAQSFIGGFISSTTTFVRLTSISANDQASSQLIISGLLASYVAMLIECMIIFYSFNGLNHLYILIPIVVQLIFFLGILIVKTPREESTDTLILKAEHPILWKKVFTFSGLIILLILILRFIGHWFSGFTYAVTFVLSLFEAHGVFAASLSNMKATNQFSILLELMFILSGNFLSKSFFVLRNKQFALRLQCFLYFLTSLILAWISYFLVIFF